jgi:hypothetical protein
MAHVGPQRQRKKKKSVEGDVGVTLLYYCHSFPSVYYELSNISPCNCFVFLSTHPFVVEVTSVMTATEHQAQGMHF